MEGTRQNMSSEIVYPVRLSTSQVVARISYINSRNTLPKKIVNGQTCLEFHQSFKLSNWQYHKLTRKHHFHHFPFPDGFPNPHPLSKISRWLSKSSSPHPNLNCLSTRRGLVIRLPPIQQNRTRMTNTSHCHTAIWPASPVGDVGL